MEYRRLGKSGLQLSALSLGSWITFGSNLDIHGVRDCIKKAFNAGVNFFDNAEVYANGASELLMGEVLKSYRRDQLVISTKIFWGGEGPNQMGLSYKHLMDGTKNSLKRLQLDYVDLLYCHRPDPETPIEETVRAMDALIKQGFVYYWGTSEWSIKEIEEAFEIAYRYNLTPPTMEQPEYNLFHRERVENEYAPLYKKRGLGTTVWSPLASGVLTGKYNELIPQGSRLHKHRWLKERLTEEKLAKVKELGLIAKKLNVSLASLAIAWCLKNPDVSSVIMGATSLEQLEDNLKALEVVPLLSHEICAQIESIFGGSV